MVQAWPTIRPPTRTDLPPDRPVGEESLNDFCARHYRRHPGQIGFLQDPARYRFACSGVGGGKSEVGSFEAVRYCVRYPGILGLVVAPSYRMLNRSTLLALRKVLRWWGDTLVWQHRKSDNMIVFPDRVGANGEPSTLFLAHCQDPDTLRGPDVAFFFADEAALYKEETWKVLLGRIRQPGYPHRGWLCSTPKGQNWLYRGFVEGREDWPPGRRAEYGYHHWRTGDNPLYISDPTYLQSLAEAYGVDTDFYRQEVNAEFVTFAGIVYRQWDPMKMLVDPPTDLNVFVRFWCGIDWGVSSAGCMLVIGETARQDVVLLEEIYERGRIISGAPDGNDWLTEAKGLRDKYPGLKFRADPEDANAVETFRRAGLNIQPAMNKRLPGVRACQSLLASGRWKVVKNAAPNWEAEIGQYHWQDDADGNPKEDADPAKEFDHAMDSWRYVAVECATPLPEPGMAGASEWRPGVYSKSPGGTVGDPELQHRLPKPPKGQKGYKITYPGDPDYPGDPTGSH